MSRSSTLILTATLALGAGQAPAMPAAPAGASASETEAEPLEAEPLEAWAALLAAHVRDGGIDYAAVAADRAGLDRYLASLAAPLPASATEAERLAFWMNAYNAVVVHFVLERYPGLASVRDVDGFFDAQTFPVAGEPRTLDAIEGKARELDPRSHFAVVCASTSCPDLLDEPYRPARLDEQLDAQTRAFLAQPKGLRWEPSDETLHLSSIFKWYAGDFTGGSTLLAFFSRGRVLDWVLPYLPPAQAAEIEAADPAVRYLDYDWSLNDRSTGG